MSPDEINSHEPTAVKRDKNQASTGDPLYSTFFELRLDDSNQDWSTISLTKKINRVLYMIRSST